MKFSFIFFNYLLKFIIIIIIWLYHVAYRILVPRLGIELRPKAVKAWSPNLSTAREFPEMKVSYIFQWKLDLWLLGLSFL